MSDAAILTKTPTRLQTLGLLRRAVRNPMDFWPREIYLLPMVRMNVLGGARYFVADPALIQHALVDNADRLHKSEPMRRALEPALGHGMLTAEDERWRLQRRVASPVFRPGHVNSFLPAMIRAARATRDAWQGLPEGAPIEAGHEMMHLTFEIILETMLSGRGDIDGAQVERSMADFLEATSWAVVLSVLGAPDWLPYPGRGRSERGCQYLREMVAGRAAARRQSGERHDDLLSLLLDTKDPDSGAAFSDTEVVDNILTFIAAGHETTALALTWTFFLLSHHPEIEAAILAEIQAVTGGAPLEAEQVAQLAYTRQVVMESMRIYPPVAAVGRTVMQGFSLGGQDLVPGDRVLVPIYAVHHHALLWEAPEVFDPARFSPEAIRARHRFAWLPFGAGSRICIGMQFALLEAVAILGTLLPAVHLRAKPGYVPVPKSRITMRPAEGMPMTIVHRTGG
jgi:cytochrome P450